MVKKSTGHGNRMAVPAGQPIVHLPNIDAGTPLDITTDGRRLIPEPASQSDRPRKFEAALRAAYQRYGNALKRLAD